MPYTKEEARVKYEDNIQDLVNKIMEISLKDENEVYGDLNYIVSSLLVRYIDKKGYRYFRLQNLLAVLECAKLEFYRKQVAPYEDEAERKNGDIHKISK